jgi:hypothetical protein
MNNVWWPIPVIYVLWPVNKSKNDKGATKVNLLESSMSPITGDTTMG